MMSPAKTRERFTALQMAWREQSNRAGDYAATLGARYQKSEYAPRPKRARLERMRVAERKASDRMYALVESISPRDWRSGVPCSWLRDSLTYEDAITPGQLAIVPRPAYGYTEQDMRQFAWPIKALSVEVRKEAGYYSVYVNGVRTIDRESFTVADRVAEMVKSGRYDTSESADVAQSIRKHWGAQ